MNVTVTMLQSGRTDDWGRPLVAGSSYSLDFDRARSLWQAGFASVEDGRVFDDEASYKSTTGLVKSIGFTGFRKCMLASLVAGSMAARTGGLVTITAAAHGITTGTTYQGFRFFYPGSPSLAAGWYDSISSVPTTGTLTFTAPGADFGSESINGGLANTSQSVVPGSAIVKGGFFDDFSRAKVGVSSGGGLTAATKSFRFLVNGVSLSATTVTTNPFGTKEIDLIPTGPTSLGMVLVNGSLNGILSATVDKSLDIEVAVALTVSAAADFVILFPSPSVTLLGG